MEGRENMSGITLEEAKKHLDAWLKAELSVINGQSISFGTRSLTRANLTEIRNQIEYWRGMVAKLNNIAKRNGKNRVRRAIPRDL